MAAGVGEFQSLLAHDEGGHDEVFTEHIGHLFGVELQYHVFLAVIFHIEVGAYHRCGGVARIGGEARTVHVVGHGAEAAVGHLHAVGAVAQRPGLLGVAESHFLGLGGVEVLAVGIHDAVAGAAALKGEHGGGCAHGEDVAVDGHIVRTQDGAVESGGCGLLAAAGYHVALAAHDVARRGDELEIDGLCAVGYPIRGGGHSAQFSVEHGYGLDGGGSLHGNGTGIEGALSGGRGAVGGVVYLGSLGLAGDGHLLCLGVDTGFRGEGGNGHIAHTFVVERHGAVVVAGDVFHRAFHKVGAVAVLVVELGGRCGRLVEGFGRLVGEEVAGLAYLIAVVIVI